MAAHVPTPGRPRFRSENNNTLWKRLRTVLSSLKIGLVMILLHPCLYNLGDKDLVRAVKLNVKAALQPKVRLSLFLKQHPYFSA